MSRRLDVNDRIRELARKNPAWSPSQIAIYLQGEGEKVTSEDVRRSLARRGSAEDGSDATASRYTAPREEPRRSAFPIGLLFGVLIFALSLGVTFLGAPLSVGARLALSFATLTLLLPAAGAVASRRYASGPIAGLVAMLVYTLLALGGLFTQMVATGLTIPAALGMTAGGLLDPRVLVYLLIWLSLGPVLGLLGAALFGRKRRRPTFG
jgi:hypothetical protein